MKRVYLLALCAMLLLLLAACGCEHEWKDATCDAPKTCALCGETEGEPLAHQWQDATCTAPKTCALCSKTEGEALGHSYPSALPDCENPILCGNCGEPEREAYPHAWVEATCDAPKTCSVCGKTEGEPAAHQWQDATCSAPKTCTLCGATEGETLEHTWTAADCTTARSCSVCGAMDGAPMGHSWMAATCEAPKTCENCGATEGEAKDHDWQDATCVMPKVCANCHATEGEAKGHKWQAATSDKPKTCSVCGATDGDKLNVDSRFKTDACKFLFGEWKTQVTEDVDIYGDVYTMEYWGCYEFREDGTVVISMAVDDEEQFRADYAAMMVEMLYATYEQLGMSRGEVDAMFQTEMGMSITEFCTEYTEELLAAMMEPQVMVYYVEGNQVYLAETWKSEFAGAEYEVIDGLIHLRNAETDEVHVLVPMD